MGLKGYRLGLWVNLIQRAEPHLVRAKGQERHGHDSNGSGAQSVAVQKLRLKKQRLETSSSSSSLHGRKARVETRRFFSYGSAGFSLYSPHQSAVEHSGPRVFDDCTQRRQEAAGDGARGVAVQVAFERQTLKPVFSLDGL
jgi:hypothetical protein